MFDNNPRLRHMDNYEQYPLGFKIIHKSAVIYFDISLFFRGFTMIFQ